MTARPAPCLSWPQAFPPVMSKGMAYGSPSSGLACVPGFKDVDDGSQMRREADLARAELTRKIQGIRGRQSQVRYQGPSMHAQGLALELAVNDGLRMDSLRPVNCPELLPAMPCMPSASHTPALVTKAFASSAMTGRLPGLG